MHEYKLTEYSLYAAMSMGLSSAQIVDALESMSKTTLPTEIKEFVLKIGRKMGKIRVLLKDGNYFLEFWEMEMLEKVQRDTIMAQCFEGDEKRSRKQHREFIVPIQPKPNEETSQGIDLFEIFDDNELVELDMNQFQDTIRPETEGSIRELHTPIADSQSEPIDQEVDIIPVDAEEVVDEWIYTIQVKTEKLEIVKKRCADLQIPLLEEYDFHNDSILPRLNIDLKPATKLRPYQEQSLGKMFGNGRARSGIIVLPCGAGKTLVGVTAACTIKKSCLVLCNSTLSVEQWAREFRYWSTIQPDQLAKFSSESKLAFTADAGVLISTYTMIAYSGKRAYDAQKMMEFLQSREWGFVLLDEVHVVPADMFKKTLTIVAAHSKLGLTATLVREDDKIDSLNWLIGPKLYEANWLELIDDGFIANVQCAEVWCTMATPFYREYLRASPRKRQLLYVMNPHKLQACQYLIQLHESMGDKIIVFSDNIFALKHYAERLQKPYIYGGTSQAERMRVLQQFRFNPALNTIFLSKVGDTSLDLPEATCLIQISSQYGSRRQEAQRLGRILRPKKGQTRKLNAYFYSLVSTDTEEMYYATKRQQFLVDQGYEFKVFLN
jgi:DNA excision repair protein ERCC-3